MKCLVARPFARNDGFRKKRSGDAEIGRVFKPGGKAMITYLLLDDLYRRHIRDCWDVALLPGNSGDLSVALRPGWYYLGRDSPLTHSNEQHRTVLGIIAPSRVPHQVFAAVRTRNE